MAKTDGQIGTNDGNTGIFAKQKPVRVVLIDMDDTITNTEKYSNTIESGRPVPPDFFIKDSLEFLKSLKKSGVKIGLVSHAYVGHSKILKNTLKAMGIKFDSLLTIANFDPVQQELEKSLHVDDFTNLHKSLVSKHGKNVNSNMAEQSFRNMGLKPDSNGKYSNVEIVTIGDSDADLMLSYHSLKELGVAKAKPVHIHAVNLKPIHLDMVYKSIDFLKKEGISPKQTKSYSEIRTFMSKIWPDINLAPQTVQKEKKRLHFVSNALKQTVNTNKGNVPDLAKQKKSPFNPLNYVRPRVQIQPQPDNNKFNQADEKTDSIQQASNSAIKSKANDYASKLKNPEAKTDLNSLSEQQKWTLFISAQKKADSNILSQTSPGISVQ